MQRHLIKFLAVLVAGFPLAAAAQSPAPAAAPAAGPLLTPTPGQTNIPTGTPQGVPYIPPNNSRGFPVPNTVEGQPIETRLPEKADDAPAFPGQTRAPYRATQPFQVTTITDKLKAPWSLAFLPDGKMLVTEKAGNLRVVDGAGNISEPVSGVPQVLAIGQVGLLEVVVDPKFRTNHRIFLSYSEADGDVNSHVAIARASFDEAGLALSDVKTIFRVTPSLPAAALQANQGGKIAIAKDGTLFVTVGDRAKSPPWDVAQHLDTDLGKMIHITADGAPAADNPFLKTSGALPEIWSYGHRSEEGLTFDAATGKLWEIEDGPRGGDELNLIERGKNYGWPIITHGIDYPGIPIGAGITQKKGLEQPRYYWDPVIAPSGLAVYHGKLFPDWQGSLLVGALRGQMLDRLAISGDKVVAEEPLLAPELHTRIRDVRVGPEGAVYVLTDSGKLFKLTPK